MKKDKKENVVLFDHLGRLAPQDVEAEIMVLGAILINSDAIYDVLDELRPEYFYKEAHQVIIEKKLAPCDKKEALYHQEFIVTNEGEFKKIENSPNVYNVNKCASDLLDQILPELKNWTPVQKDSNNITARSLFAFFPDDCLIITKRVMILKN